MIDPNMITNLLGNAKLTANDISKMVSEKSPLPVPAAAVQTVLDQLVQQGKIKKTSENGQTYYHL